MTISEWYWQWENSMQRKAWVKERHQNQQLSHNEICLNHFWRSYTACLIYMKHTKRLKGDEHLPGLEARNLSGSRWVQGSLWADGNVLKRWHTVSGTNCANSLKKRMNYITMSFIVCSDTPKKFLKSKTKSALLKTQMRKADHSIYT